MPLISFTKGYFGGGGGGIAWQGLNRAERYYCGKYSRTPFIMKKKTEEEMNEDEGKNNEEEGRKEKEGGKLEKEEEKNKMLFYKWRREKF